MDPVNSVQADPVWDGVRWLSADGLWWWDGGRWLPTRPILRMWNPPRWRPLLPAALIVISIAWVVLTIVYSLGPQLYRDLISLTASYAALNALAAALLIPKRRGFAIAGACVVGLSAFYSFVGFGAGDNVSLGTGIGGLFFLGIIVAGFVDAGICVLAIVVAIVSVARCG